MKNILTAFAFIATMFVGVQTASAQSLKQDQNRPEVVAKEESNVLSQELGLDGNQTRALFRALVTHKIDLNKAAEGKNVADPAVKAEVKQIDERFEGTMKKILNEEQYKQWAEKQ